MVEKNRKLYLDSSLSVIETFRQSVRWVKSSAVRESQFEKPYIDDEYRKMHLEFPTPDWPKTPDPPPNGDIEPTTRRMRFGTPRCWGHVFSAVCDGPTWGTVHLVMVPPHSQGASLRWSLSCEDPRVKTWPNHGNTSLTGSFEFMVEPRESFKDTVILEISCVMVGGSYAQEWETEGSIPKDASIPPFLRTDLFGLIWTEIESVEGKIFDCGKFPVEYNCGCTLFEWDDETSEETVDHDDLGGSIIAIYAEGFCEPFDWEVEEEGFTLAESRTYGFNNIIYADETACGTATITVTNREGSSVTGYVRCTEGQWIEVDEELAYPNGNCLGGYLNTTPVEVIIGDTKWTGDKCTIWDGNRCATANCENCSCHNCSNCSAMTGTTDPIPTIERTCLEFCNNNNWCQTYTYNTIVGAYITWKWTC
jgi:hypothetical protein